MGKLSDFVGSSSSGSSVAAKAPKGVKVGIELDSIMGMEPVDTTEALGGKIEKLMAAMAFVSFGEAWKAVKGQLGDKAFKQSDCQTLIQMFDSVKPGASALLLGASGMYAGRAPVEAHYKFLTEAGYKVVPAVALKSAKVERKRI